MTKISALVAALSLTAISGVSMAATSIVNGGTVNFKGDIIEAACAVDSESLNQTVELGQVKASVLQAAGDESDAKNFNIKLNNCSVDMAKKVSFSFLGTSIGGGDNTVLGLSGATDGSAKNVGIAIFDPSNEKITIDGSEFGAETTLVNGTNIIPFKARYVATGTAKAGQANAVASFNIKYD